MPRVPLEDPRPEAPAAATACSKRAGPPCGSRRDRPGSGGPRRNRSLSSRAIRASSTRSFGSSVCSASIANFRALRSSGGPSPPRSRISQGDANPPGDFGRAFLGLGAGFGFGAGSGESPGGVFDFFLAILGFPFPKVPSP